MLQCIIIKKEVWITPQEGDLGSIKTCVFAQNYHFIAHARDAITSTITILLLDPYK